VGDALFDCKVYYFNNLYFPDPWAGDPDWTPQQNLLDYTLFGDPSLVREGVGILEEPVEGIKITGILVYPNPMHSRGFIEYTLPFADTVGLSLYNVAGQKVTTLHRGWQKPGFHKIHFSKAGLTGGIYFIRMELKGKNYKETLKEKIILF